MNIWTLIRTFMQETEQANNIKFENSAWDRAKKLDQDIEAYIFMNYKERQESDGLLLCKVCADRYTLNTSRVCDSCRRQEAIDRA